MATKAIVIHGVMTYEPDAPSQPPSIWGGANEPFPGYGLPGQPPGTWGGSGTPMPTPPIHLPPPGFGHHPAHPIVLPPHVPAHPIVIPGPPPVISIWPPLPNNDLPDPPPPVDPCHTLVYSLRYGWALVQLARK